MLLQIPLFKPMARPLPKINPGDRAILAGRTGSGKSTLARFLLERSPGHWVILNPKGTKAYDKLPDINTVNGFDLKKISKSIEKHRFTNIVPSLVQSNADTMDAFIMWLHSEYTDIGLVSDELYTLHNNGVAKQGLIGWLTRGRELKQSFLGLTQRPNWISKFVFSEADYIGGMSLNLEEDRKRMFQITGMSEFYDKLPELQWLWYTQKGDDLRLLGAVPMK